MEWKVFHTYFQQMKMQISLCNYACNSDAWTSPRTSVFTTRRKVTLGEFFFLWHGCLIWHLERLGTLSYISVLSYLQIWWLRYCNCWIYIVLRWSSAWSKLHVESFVNTTLLHRWRGFAGKLWENISWVKTVRFNTKQIPIYYYIISMLKYFCLSTERKNDVFEFAYIDLQYGAKNVIFGNFVENCSFYVQICKIAYFRIWHFEVI